MKCLLAGQENGYKRTELTIYEYNYLSYAGSYVGVKSDTPAIGPQLNLY